MAQPILSILVITHNQRDLLKRCLDSVLGQKLNVLFEVIVSDDRSDDGTAEYIAELQTQIQSGTRKVNNLQELVYTRCNSNDCNPATVSQRCGWNKLNAWRYAKGKYMVNIDADDYLLHDDIYQIQIDMLESHPECSMCQQYVLQVKDGEDPSTGLKWPISPKMQQGAIITAEDVIAGGLRGLNQTYMMRRQLEDDMSVLYGKYYDDSIMTIHHLQYGAVVFIDRADYVWVLYPKSISNSLVGDDNLVSYALLPLHHIHYFPQYLDLFMREALPFLVHLFKELAAKRYRLNLTKPTIDAYAENQGYIYKVLCSMKPSLWDQIKMRYIRLVLLLSSKYKLQTGKFIYKLLIK